MRACEQGARRQPARSGRDEAGSNCHGDQHTRRERDQRFIFDSAYRARTSSAVFHHNGRCERGGSGNRGLEEPWVRGARAAGLPSRLARVASETMGKDERGAKMLQITSPVAGLPGIGPKRAAALEARGLATAGDLIFHLPARYQDWRERTPSKDLRAGVMAVVEGDLGRIVERPMRGSRWRRLASGWLDASGRRIRVVWFNLPAYMRGYLPGGERVLVRGRVAADADGGIEIVQPELHRLSDGEPKGIRPVYRLPSIVGQRLFANLVSRALSELGDSIDGAIPDEVRGDVPTVREALNFLHDPP